MSKLTFPLAALAILVQIHPNENMRTFHHRADSPLQDFRHKLEKLKGVTETYFTSDYQFTVTKAEMFDWSELFEPILELFAEVLGATAANLDVWVRHGEQGDAKHAQVGRERPKPEDLRMIVSVEGQRVNVETRLRDMDSDLQLKLKSIDGVRQIGTNRYGFYFYVAPTFDMKIVLVEVIEAYAKTALGVGINELNLRYEKGNPFLSEEAQTVGLTATPLQEAAQEPAAQEPIEVNRGVYEVTKGKLEGKLMVVAHKVPSLIRPEEIMILAHPIDKFCEEGIPHTHGAANYVDAYLSPEDWKALEPKFVADIPQIHI